MLLALEAPLMERLRERLDAGVTVVALRALGDLRTARLPTPCAIVAYAGGAVAETRPDGRAARATQRWQVAACARNVADASDSAAAVDAAKLADDILAALLGWHPDGASAPLSLSGLPLPIYGSGYLGLPVELSTEVVLRATP